MQVLGGELFALPLLLRRGCTQRMNFFLLCIKTKEEVNKQLIKHREEKSSCCNSIRLSGQDAHFLSKTPNVEIESNVWCQILLYVKKAHCLFSGKHFLRPRTTHRNTEHLFCIHFMTQIFPYILFTQYLIVSHKFYNFKIFCFLLSWFGNLFSFV